MTILASGDQTVQQWGNGLGIRITGPIAAASHLTRGMQVKLEVVEGGIFIRAAGDPSLVLAQKLKAFNPKIHGGSVA